MGLRIAEQAGATDVGRQRHTNEDDLLIAPPFFAVADGMGGAKAGEVASHLATEAFAAREGDELSPEHRLAQIAREANRRIYDLASRDESRRGMGTTLTAALVSRQEVSIGHVGDSRAYRLREGRLEQLTRDHSLVAELERTGQISAEAAEQHPQRSIITRALGPEPDVDVDTYTVPGRRGDVFLLCSDGLTSMVADDEVAAILRRSSSLEEAAQTLVRAANQSGGKDNITVVLFRLEEEAGAEEEAAAEPAADETLAGQVRAEEVARPRPPAAPRRRRLRPRVVLTGLLALLAVVAVVGGLYALSRQVYFVGTNDAGLVTLYRGLPYELPLGIELYDEEYASGVPASAIPTARRQRILDHEWRGKDDAVDLVRELERGRLE